MKAIDTITTVGLLAVMAIMPARLDAHRQWMLPSSTVLSGSDPWVTVDAAVSNELFYFDHVPMRPGGIDRHRSGWSTCAAGKHGHWQIPQHL